MCKTFTLMCLTEGNTIVIRKKNKRAIVNFSLLKEILPFFKKSRLVGKPQINILISCIFYDFNSSGQLNKDHEDMREIFAMFNASAIIILLLLTVQGVNIFSKLTVRQFHYLYIPTLHFLVRITHV